MSEQFNDDYRPLPIFPPEVARISVGFSNDGHLAVEVRSVKAVTLMPGLKELFEKAAVEFMRVFSAEQQLLASIRRAGVDDNPVNQQIQETADRDGAVKIDKRAKESTG